MQEVGQFKNNEPTTSVGLSLLKMPSLFLFLFFPMIPRGYYQGIFRVSWEKDYFYFLPDGLCLITPSQQGIPKISSPGLHLGGCLFQESPITGELNPTPKGRFKWRTSVWVWYWPVLGGYPDWRVKIHGSGQGEVLVTWTRVHINLLEPGQDQNHGKNVLLDLEPESKPWKNILKKL